MKERRKSKVKVHSIALLLMIAFGLIGARLIIEAYNAYQDDAPKVLVNQVGYHRWDTRKEFLVQYSSYLSNGEFELYSTTTNTKVLDGDLSYLGELWGNHYWKGNLSTITQLDNFEIRAFFDGFNKPIKSYEFKIGDDIYNESMILGYQFFYYQRSGCEVIDHVVPGYVGHEACHMDDASYENGTYRDVHGAWFDAGDYNKYNGLTPLAFLSLVEGFDSYRALYETGDTNNTYPNSTNAEYHQDYPDILEEAIWGADFLVRCTYGSGYMTGGKIGSNEYHGHYGYWGPPGDETDNDPDTFYDNRRLHYEGVGSGVAMQTCYGLIKLARILNETGAYSTRAATYTDTAMRILNYYNASSGNNAIKALIYWELFMSTGNTSYRQLSNVIGMGNVQTWLNWGSTGFGHIGVDNSYSYTMQWALLNGSASVLSQVEAKIDERWNAFWEPYYNSSDTTNFFNILKGHIWYPSNGSWYDEYFYHKFRDTGSDWNVGQNSYYLCAAWANCLAYKINNDTRHLDFANSMFNWVFGKNPFSLCMVEGVGSYNVPKYHHRASAIPGNPYGKMPGCVPNGITRKGRSNDDPEIELDLPYFDLEPAGPVQYSADYCSTEPWIPHNSYFILALNMFCNATSGL
ncbi:MAG: glycoside hydrolase family 9 protein [Candidatus Hodarchaeota archaeon]